mgnify:CR=1 FL=1
MPYVFIDDENFDEESMGAPADVVTREDFNTLQQDRDDLRVQAVALADNLSAELKDARDRYARHVITNGEIMNRVKQDVIENGTAQSFEELFSDRTKG